MKSCGSQCRTPFLSEQMWSLQRISPDRRCFQDTGQLCICAEFLKLYEYFGAIFLHLRHYLCGYQNTKSVGPSCQAPYTGSNEYQFGK